MTSKSEFTSPHIRYIPSRLISPYRLAEAADFRSTCANLIARIINTVPPGVTLTEVIEPLPVKPVAVQLTWLGNGKMRLSGEVRVSHSAPVNKTLVRTEILRTWVL